MSIRATIARPKLRYLLRGGMPFGTSSFVAMDSDRNSALRKERWSQKVKRYMNKQPFAQPAPSIDATPVALYDLDTSALPRKNGPVANNNKSASSNKSARGVVQDTACQSPPRIGSAQDTDTPTYASKKVSEHPGSNAPSDLRLAEGFSSSAYGALASVADPIDPSEKVIKRLVGVATSISSTHDSSARVTSRSNSLPILGMQAVVTGCLPRVRMQMWAEKARRKLDIVESNACCATALQLFTLSLSVFELSQVCTENIRNVRDEMCIALNAIDLTGNLFFALEVLLYLMIFPWKHLCKSFHFWVDVFAMVTYYTRLIVGWNSNENVAIELLVISIPWWRILKITRRSKSWRLLVMVLRRSAEPITVPALFLTLVVSVASGLLYWIEKAGSPPGQSPSFDSIPHAAWFSIVTISTTGYGDVIPQTQLGKLACVVLIGVGVCCFAMPLAVVGNVFCSIWEQRDVILLTDQLKSMFSIAGVTFVDLQQIFEAADVDRSGEMDVDEFIGWFRMLELDIGRRQIVKFFQMMDFAGKGKVSFDEFGEYLAMCQAVDLGNLPMRTHSIAYGRINSARTIASKRRRSSLVHSDDVCSNRSVDLH